MAIRYTITIMNLIEFQGKQLLKHNHIPVPNSIFIEDSEALQNMHYPIMLKSQVLTGQRGKNGGILQADTYRDAVDKYQHLKNLRIKGLTPLGVMAEDRVEIKTELYFSVMLNRHDQCLTLMFSKFGGMNIEEVDAQHINKVNINPLVGVQEYNLLQLLKNTDFTKPVLAQIKKLAWRLVGIYGQYNLELLEINPLVITKVDEVMVLDAKITVDDNCAGQPLAGITSIDATATYGDTVEAVSKRWGVNGVRLDGDVAVITSGAGVGMASIDTIKDIGGSVHSFVDMGALVYQKEAMTEIITTIIREKPKSLLFSFFFQVASCEIIARAIVDAVRETGTRLPMVIRARGQKLAEAQQVLTAIDHILLDDFTEACAAAVESVK